MSQLKQDRFIPKFIVILLVIIGGYIVYKKISMISSREVVSPSPTSNVTSEDWITYTNTKYAFSLKFPSSYDSHKNPGKDNAITDNQALVTLDDKNKTDHFVVVVISKKITDPEAYNGREYNPFTSNLDKLLASKVGSKTIISIGASYERLPNEQIAGKTAAVFVNSQEQREGYEVIDNGTYIYVLGRYNGDSEVFKQIFSSFTLN